MSDPEDGDRRDGPSAAPAEEDPFEYPSDETADGAPPDRTPQERPTGPVGWLKWFWTTDSGAAIYVRDVVTSVAAVLLVGLVLFAVSGIWPPMVAVESGSMEPNMNVGDLVFVVDNERFVPGEAVAHEGRTTGVVPADRGADVGHTEFGRPGDVIVFMPNGDARRTPVIHRAMLWVEEGENWYDRADPEAVGNAADCDELNNCPAPHAGFVTKGDNERTNKRYDQVSGLSSPVRPGWIIGTAEVKVPYLGHVRLALSGQVAPSMDSTITTDRPDADAPRPPTASAGPVA